MEHGAQELSRHRSDGRRRSTVCAWQPHCRPPGGSYVHVQPKPPAQTRLGHRDLQLSSLDQGRSTRPWRAAGLRSSRSNTVARHPSGEGARAKMPRRRRCLVRHRRVVTIRHRSGHERRRSAPLPAGPHSRRESSRTDAAAAVQPVAQSSRSRAELLQRVESDRERAPAAGITAAELILAAAWAFVLTATPDGDARRTWT